MTADTSSRIPPLGPRGEGWVVLQFTLLVVIAILGLDALAAHGPAHPWGPAAVAAGGLLIGAGVLVAIRAAHDLRAGLSPFPRPVAGAPLVDTGAFRWIRHPIYAGLLVASAGWGLLTGSAPVLVATAGLAVVLDVKSRREEAWLSATHPGYRAYRRRTRRFVPFLY